MSKLYVIVGRFQPLHTGHVDMILDTLNAMTDSDELLFLLGSSNKTRSPDNPFTYEERKEAMEIFLHQEKNLYKIAPLKDFDYDDDLWETNLHKVVQEQNPNKLQPVFVASSKGGDNKLRLSWARGCEVRTYTPSAFSLMGECTQPLSATEVRDYMGRNFGKVWKSLIVGGTESCYTEGVKFLIHERAVVSSYRQSWQHSPFPPLFTATDAVVRDGEGRFLLIKRGGEMGTGDLALAGGFLEEFLTYEDNMKKELLEEANLDLDSVHHTIVTSWMCDAVYRAHRGRMTTVAFLVQLPLPFEEYDIKAGDDAASVEFKTLEEIHEIALFNDHYGLILKLLKLERMGVPYIKNH